MNGFKSRIKEIVLGMQAIRTSSEAARNIGLRQYLAETEAFKDATPDDIYIGLGIDPNRTTFGELFDKAELKTNEDGAYLAAEIIADAMKLHMGLLKPNQTIFSHAVLNDPSQRWLVPEQFAMPVEQGALSVAFYFDLVASEETVAHPNVLFPTIEFEDDGPDARTQGVTIKQGIVKYKTRNVLVKNYTKGLEIPYEALRYSTINLVSMMFQRFGRRLGARLNRDAVTCLINGDQADLSQNAAVIGVANANTFAYEDITEVFVHMLEMGYVPIALVGNGTMVKLFLNLNEVKNNQNSGGRLINARLKRPMPSDVDVYPSAGGAANQLTFADPSAAMVQLTAEGFNVEVDKIIQRRVQEANYSVTTGFAKFDRQAVVVVDKSLALSGNGWPSWMTLVE